MLAVSSLIDDAMRWHAWPGIRNARQNSSRAGACWSCKVQTPAARPHSTPSEFRLHVRWTRSFTAHATACTSCDNAESFLIVTACYSPKSVLTLPSRQTSFLDVRLSRSSGQPGPARAFRAPSLHWYLVAIETREYETELQNFCWLRRIRKHSARRRVATARESQRPYCSWSRGILLRISALQQRIARSGRARN